jgi:hypothetical protein
MENTSYIRVRKKAHPFRCAFPKPIELTSAEAIAAINGTVGAGLKRNLAGLAASGANCVVHLTAAAVTVLLPRVPAGLAALRLVGEALLRVKLLLAGSESEFLAAILADDDFVVVHEIPLK